MIIYVHYLFKTASKTAMNFCKFEHQNWCNSLEWACEEVEQHINKLSFSVVGEIIYSEWNKNRNVSVKWDYPLHIPNDS